MRIYYLIHSAQPPPPTPRERGGVPLTNFVFLSGHLYVVSTPNAAQNQILSKILPLMELCNIVIICNYYIMLIFNGNTLFKYVIL